MLHVTNNEPDGQNVTTRFYVYDLASGSLVHSGSDGPKSESADFSREVPASQLKHGASYRWRAIASDSSLDGPYSDWCEFTMDLEAPQPPAVSSADYPADQWSGAAGQPGMFAFSPNAAGDTKFGNDVDFYEWAIGNDNPTTPAEPTSLGAAVTIPITPSTFGPNVLYLRSVDQAGNRSATVTYTFKPNRPCADPAADSCAAAAYALDEPSGSSASDASGHGRTATIVGGEWVAGQQSGSLPSDRALRFDGADYATAVSAVDTRQAFTVMAWVKPATVSKDIAVVSQAGDHGNGFTLYYSAGLSRWVFGRHDAATAGAAVVRAMAPAAAPAQAGVWTHVAGVYDPVARTLALYVDGQRQGEVTTGGLWNAAGGLQLGRDRPTTGAWGNQLVGDLDDVRAYPGLLEPADIRQIWLTSSPA